jgi:hypothetical protein
MDLVPITDVSCSTCRINRQSECEQFTGRGLTIEVKGDSIGIVKWDGNDHQDAGGLCRFDHASRQIIGNIEDPRQMSKMSCKKETL